MMSPSSRSVLYQRERESLCVCVCVCVCVRERERERERENTKHVELLTSTPTDKLLAKQTRLCGSCRQSE